MKINQYYTAILVLVLGSTGCAKMGSLTGGPKDEIPPRVLECRPSNYSTNFEAKRIEIIFDEFIVLNNINQELVVSPPLEERPVVRIKNKSIIIDLETELRDSTTYTLNFGEAIEDNNEGNPLSNYEFVFSTGDYLDSLRVGGSLVNAFDLKKPEEPVSIMLYDKLEDSIVHKEIPVYIGKTDKEGNFRINNLRPGIYKIFALKDVNNNFLFDLPNETIAFADSFLNVDPTLFIGLEEEVPVVQDTLQTDTTFQDSTRVSDSGVDTMTNTVIADSLSLMSDSTLIIPLPPIPEELKVDLLLFTEENLSQFLSDNKRETRNRIDFSFNRPVSDSFLVRSLIPESENWYMVEESAERDSFTYWIMDKAVRELDTIQLELNYVVLDSTENRIWKKDSLYFNFREVVKAVKKKETDARMTDEVTFSGLKNNATIELNANLKLISETPVNYIDTSLIEFYRLEDTLMFREDYEVLRDSIKTRIIHFKKEWEPETSFELTLFPGAVMDVFGGTNDTAKYKFKIRKEDYYGTLIVNMDSIPGPMIIQLLDKKENLLREHYMESSGTYHFEYLKADAYILKFIHDTNGNRKWDTGKYSLKMQPEKVEFYKGEIQVRSNWELEINYEGRKD